MKAIDILIKLHRSGFLPGLVKIWDGALLCANLNDDPTFYHLIDGKVKGNAWYCCVPSCLANASFDNDGPCFAARIEYVGYEFVCIEIEN